jgi:hypothetical protein
VGLHTIAIDEQVVIVDSVHQLSDVFFVLDFDFDYRNFAGLLCSGCRRADHDLDRKRYQSFRLEEEVISEGVAGHLQLYCCETGEIHGALCIAMFACAGQDLFPMRTGDRFSEAQQIGLTRNRRRGYALGD